MINPHRPISGALGAKVRSNPQPLEKARPPRRSIFGKDIYRLGAVDSTQDYLKDLFYQGAAEGTIVFAEDQHRGRGRREKNWHSSSGKGLWMSILLEPEGPEDLWTWTSLWLGIVVAEALAELCRESLPLEMIRPQLKWPNDVVLGKRKLGGILAERIQDGGGRRAIVAGIGVNLLQAPEDFPPHLRSTATSLLIASGETYLPDAPLEKLIISLEKQYSLLKPVNPTRIKKCWLAQAWNFEQRWRVINGDESVSGKFCDLGRFGEICLSSDAGGIHRFLSADQVEFLGE